jgi:YD repeat-containing protein
MKTLLAGAAAAVCALLCTLPCTAGAAEEIKSAPSLRDRFRVATMYHDGQLLKLRTPRGVTRYVYAPDGKLSRKILPGGVTVDYLRDREGRVVETRFSTGLVRTSHYDRDGKLSHIVGSDGFVLRASGPAGARTVQVTGPGNYQVDMTPMFKKGGATYASQMGSRHPRALSKMIDDDGGCGFLENGDNSCDWSGDGWGGGGGDGGDGSGQDEWGGDTGAGDYGDDAGYIADDDTGGERWGGGGDYAGTDFGNDPTGVPGSPGDLGYLRCMAAVCEVKNREFKDFCSGESPRNQELCYRVALRHYLTCERKCWYENY